MRKKILIIGSSMAMPRSEVSYEETWVCKLKYSLKDFDIIDKCTRGSTSNRLNEEGGGYKGIDNGADLLEHYEPDYVVTQIGITDCAPRYLKKEALFTKLINKSPSLIKNTYYRYVRKYKQREPENSDVSLYQFEVNWNNYINRCANIGTKVLLVKISPFTEFGFKKNIKLVDSIRKYNEVFSRLEKDFEHVYTIDAFSDEDIRKFAIDEFHVNKDGHKKLFELILKKIEEIS